MSLDNISESKKSELVRKEEAIASDRTKVDAAKKELSRNIKEFDTIMDAKIAKFKKEQSVFDSKASEVRATQKEEQKRLDSRARIQSTEKQSMLKLSDEYTKGIESNNIEKNGLASAKKSIEDKYKSIEAKIKELKVQDKKTEAMLELFKKEERRNKASLKDVADKEAALLVFKNNTRAESDKVNSFHQEVLSLKAKHVNVGLENDSKERELREFDRNLKGKENYFIKVKASLEERRSKISLKESDLRAKEINLKGISKDIDDKIASYYDKKEKVDIKVIRLADRTTELNKNVDAFSKTKVKVMADKEKNAAENVRLSALSDNLTDLEAHLKEWQKLMGLESRDLDKQKKILEKLRKKEGGN